MSFDASELRKLAADLGAGSRKVGPMAQVVVRKTVLDIEATAKVLAPVDTGNLKGSIGHSDLRTVGQSGTLEAEVGPTANYGRFVELGTSRMAPQPYLGPAADRHEPSFVRAMAILAERAVNGG